MEVTILLVIALIIVIGLLVYTTRKHHYEDDDIIELPRTTRIRLGQRCEGGKFNQMKDMSMTDYYFEMLNTDYFMNDPNRIKRKVFTEIIRLQIRFLDDGGKQE